MTPRVVPLAICLVGIALGIAQGYTDLWPWLELVEWTVDGDPNPAFAGTAYAILGGSIVGLWVATGFVLHHRFGGQAGTIVTAGHGTTIALAFVTSWSLPDPDVALMAIVANAFFLTIVFVTSGFARPRLRLSRNRPWALLTLVCVCTAFVGVLTTVAVRGPMFAVYNAALEQAFPMDLRLLIAQQTFVYGLIGAAFAGHFVILTGALLVWRERWVLHAVIASMVAWFVVDSVGCAMHGAWFNVAMINVPSLLATLVPAGIALRAASR